MGITAIFVTAPAAAGLYFLERHHTKANSKVNGDGLHTSKVNLLAKMRKGSGRMPKLAPRFDGLNCFVTIVGY